MAKCTYCGSKNTVCTNKIERTLAVLGGVATAIGYSLFCPSGAGGVGAKMMKEICPHNRYICVDCKKEFLV